MTFTLGNTPQDMVVQIAEGADFVSTIRRDDGDWPDGIVIELRIGDTTWPSTIVGDEARWNVDKDIVAPVLDNAFAPARLYYIDGDTELLWAKGGLDIR